MPKSNNALLPLDIRNNTNITQNNTIDNNSGEFQPAAKSSPLWDVPAGEVSVHSLMSMGVNYELVGEDRIRVIDTGAVYRLTGGYVESR